MEWLLGSSRFLTVAERLMDKIDQAQAARIEEIREQQSFDNFAGPFLMEKFYGKR